MVFLLKYTLKVDYGLKYSPGEVIWEKTRLLKSLSDKLARIEQIPEMQCYNISLGHDQSLPYPEVTIILVITIISLS